VGHLFFQRDSSGPNVGVTIHEKCLDDFDDEQISGELIYLSESRTSMKQAIVTHYHNPKAVLFLWMVQFVVFPIVGS
jgi:hypothetical protein